jgi:hypothetical protein
LPVGSLPGAFWSSIDGVQVVMKARGNLAWDDVARAAVAALPTAVVAALGPVGDYFRSDNGMIGVVWDSTPLIRLVTASA